MPVTKKVIPNRYRPYTITATSNLDVNRAIANGKGGIIYTNSTDSYALIVVTGAIKAFARSAASENYKPFTNANANVINSAINPDNT